MSASAHWRDTIAALRGKRADEQKHAEKLAEQRRAVSLKALTGGTSAQRLLSTYAKETVECRTRIEDIEAAIAEAETHLAEAERLEAAEAEAGRQRVLWELADRQLVRNPPPGAAAKSVDMGDEKGMALRAWRSMRTRSTMPSWRCSA
jgi:hypothetical protein